MPEQSQHPYSPNSFPWTPDAALLAYVIVSHCRPSGQQCWCISLLFFQSCPDVSFSCKFLPRKFHFTSSEHAFFSSPTGRPAQPLLDRSKSLSAVYVCWAALSL